MSGPSNPILRHFEFGHLPEPLRSVSERFHALAHDVAGMPTGDPAERQVSLRKLLEAKDAAVRAARIPPAE